MLNIPSCAETIAFLSTRGVRGLGWSFRSMVLRCLRGKSEKLSERGQGVAAVDQSVLRTASRSGEPPVRIGRADKIVNHDDRRIPLGTETGYFALRLKYSDRPSCSKDSLSSRANQPSALCTSFFPRPVSAAILVGLAFSTVWR